MTLMYLLEKNLRYSLLDLVDNFVIHNDHNIIYYVTQMLDLQSLDQLTCQLRFFFINNVIVYIIYYTYYLSFEF